VVAECTTRSMSGHRLTRGVVADCTTRSMSGHRLTGGRGRRYGARHPTARPSLRGAISTRDEDDAITAMSSPVISRRPLDSSSEPQRRTSTYSLAPNRTQMRVIAASPCRTNVTNTGLFIYSSSHILKAIQFHNKSTI